VTRRVFLTSPKWLAVLRIDAVSSTLLSDSGARLPPGLLSLGGRPDDQDVFEANDGFAIDNSLEAARRLAFALEKARQMGLAGPVIEGRAVGAERKGGG
jgi:hypothetical protein